MSSIQIKKNSGEFEEFNKNKLINSLRRSQIEEVTVQKIADQIESQIVDGMSTKIIYRLAFNKLKGSSRLSASKYKLKKSLMELGPTGYPFERLIGKLMQHEGYETHVGVILKGHCITHEVDVLAERDNTFMMIECKHHSDHTNLCRVKTPLYVQSRFIDIKLHWETQIDHKNKKHKGGIYTNTRFTSDALDYGTCVGLHLVSWDYPENNGLKDRIDNSGLYPLTALTSLSNVEKTRLLEKGIVLCQEIYEKPRLLDKIGVDKIRKKKIIEDAIELHRSV